jgi:phage head maturation protease
MAKVLTRVTLMIAAIGIGVPLIPQIIGMGVMCLVKAGVIDRLSYAFHAHEEHSGD